ncbi:SIS domain-containing protein [Streptacidiphilus monticola]|uniref:SIS domain-containing protein n=1 Tax=Streptacidiphilus monticola TaxID=2161674 RepID=A0ABW1G5F9_9ACTN
MTAAQAPEGTEAAGTPSLTSLEIASQPDCWRRAAALAPAYAADLPQPGERVAVVGCGTSWFVAQAYAVLREQAGLGETDAFAASEFPSGRRYDRIVGLSRSGTTTEVLQLLDARPGGARRTVVTADPETPVMAKAEHVVVLDFADERSVVQTRFATTALALFRTHLGGGAQVLAAADDAERTGGDALPRTWLEADQFSFLGRGWTYGLALEAALKMREAAVSWTEAYPAMEYRHGPIAICGPNRITWALGEVPAGLAADIARTGGRLVHDATVDPMADLVRVQRLAVARAHAQGLDPDRPRHLTRSVVLDGEG